MQHLNLNPLLSDPGATSVETVQLRTIDLRCPLESTHTKANHLPPSKLQKLTRFGERVVALITILF
jgi:hypothetical protein